MLKAVNTKILLAILAALILIGGLLVHQNHVSEAAAGVLRQQQKEHDDTMKKDAEFEEGVRQRKAKQNNDPANSSKTWQHYVP